MVFRSLNRLAEFQPAVPSLRAGTRSVLCLPLRPSKGTSAVWHTTGSYCRVQSINRCAFCPRKKNSRASRLTYPDRGILRAVFLNTLSHRPCQHWPVVAFEHNGFGSQWIPVVETKVACLASPVILSPVCMASVCHHVSWRAEQGSLRKMLCSCLDDRKHFSLLVAWW